MSTCDRVKGGRCRNIFQVDHAAHLYPTCGYSGRVQLRANHFWVGPEFTGGPFTMRSAVPLNKNFTGTTF